MDIPQSAIEAAARGMRPELWSDPDLRLAADHAKRLEFQRSVVRDAASAALRAAFPHLRPLFQHAAQVGRELALAQVRAALVAEGATQRAIRIVDDIANTASPASDASSEPLTGSGVGTGDTEEAK
jgi:hypothetical protein